MTSETDLNNKLLKSAEDGNLEEVERLLKLGADVDAKISDGWTALMLASYYGHKAIVELLLAGSCGSNGADVDAKDSYKCTALMIASYNNNSESHHAIVELLLANGADVDAKNSNGWTALMLASHKGHKEIVELLLAGSCGSNGADVDAKDSNRWTALMSASLFGHTAIVELLLTNGANVEAKDRYGWTALICASQKGHREIVKILLDAGADISCKTDNGDKSIHHADTVEMVEVLINYGADPAAIGRNNQNLLQQLQADKDSDSGRQELIIFLRDQLCIPA